MLFLNFLQWAEISREVCRRDIVHNLRINILAFFYKDFIYLFLEREEGGERGRESSLWQRIIDRLPFACALTKDQTKNPGMCPYWESNPWHFALWNDTQLIEPHWSGHFGLFLSSIHPLHFINIVGLYFVSVWALLGFILHKHFLGLDSL